MQINQLNTLIGLLVGDLSKRDRQNIMTICTIDVHAKDVVGKLIEQKVSAFTTFINIKENRLLISVLPMQFITFFSKICINVLSDVKLFEISVQNSHKCISNRIF